MKIIKLFEDFHNEEIEEEMTQEEENTTAEELNTFEDIIELLSDAGSVDDIEIEDDECEFEFNGMEFELKLEGDVILICVEVEDVADTIGSFKSYQVEKIVDAIKMYKVS